MGGIGSYFRNYFSPFPFPYNKDIQEKIYKYFDETVAKREKYYKEHCAHEYKGEYYDIIDTIDTPGKRQKIILENKESKQRKTVLSKDFLKYSKIVEIK